MANATPSIFNEKASEKLRSPDDLDKYVRVNNPSAWAVLGACACLLIGLLAWGFFGTVSTNVIVSGTVVDGKVMCLLSEEDIAKVQVGNVAVVGDMAKTEQKEMVLSEKAAVPITRDEAVKRLDSAYLVTTLMDGEWGFPVLLEGDASSLASGVPVPVNITIEQLSPLSLITRGLG